MNSNNLPSPVIFPVKYNTKTAEQLDEDIKDHFKEHSEQHLLTDYPTVYIINQSENGKQPLYTVYVGETNDIQRRTWQHLHTDPLTRKDWKELRHTNDAIMYVIGHQHFNKSMTLDIENRMMHYLSGVSSVIHLNNRRDNAQSDYYTADEMVPIFNKIWHRLHKMKPDLFPVQRIIEESAIFKASPFHRLTQQQLRAKDQIIKLTADALHNKQKSQLILVEGDAGTGKTVLMSNIFYDLANQDNQELQIVMMVNHHQQEKVYRQITDKLQISKNARIEKAATFIKKHDSDHPVDVAFIDEAHLLLTQRNQAYYGHGTNELLDIIQRARVIIAVYDEKQIVKNSEIIEKDDRQAINHYIKTKVSLNNQMRIDASPAMVEWLRKLIDDQIITKAPKDKKYDLRVFDNAADMQAAITKKAKENQDNGISRMLATFDWPYSSTSKKDGSLWETSEGSWHMPWNLQLKPTKNDRRKIKDIKYSELSWAEQPHTLKEIGSTYTIQGFDLNYAGVEIGPSVKYRNGKIVFDPSASKDKKVYQKRTMHDGSKQSFSEELIKNELNILLTRGVHGLYLHAYDKDLQQALEQAINN